MLPVLERLTPQIGQAPGAQGVRTFATSCQDGVAYQGCRATRRLGSSSERHLLAAEAWLRRAQDANTDGGVSYGYSLLAGWRPSYPETSGYIATTFFRLARERDPSYAERARRILRWLLSVQNADGSFSNPGYGK